MTEFKLFGYWDDIINSVLSYLEPSSKIAILTLFFIVGFIVYYYFYTHVPKGVLK